MHRRRRSEHRLKATIFDAMVAALLVLNAGSSSLKFTVFTLNPAPEVVLRGNIDGLYTDPHFAVTNKAGEKLDLGKSGQSIAQGHQAAIDHLFRIFSGDVLREYELQAVGHRIVHGGSKFTGPVAIDAGVMNELQSLIPLAPLHQPHSLAAVEAALAAMPDLPQVACFDTTFHQTMPSLASTFAIPQWLTEMGIRRYGFHGLSFEYIASVLPSLHPQAAEERTIVAHLGNGVSLCGLQCCRSIATTMGMTPLDGMIMGTRCGAIDPGVLLYLLDQHVMDSQALTQVLYNESGLLGLSGISSDMRALAASPDPRAREAIDQFVYRIHREIGSLAAALSGLDALVFTGGIGENSPIIRQRICQQAAWLGIELSESANQEGSQLISSAASPIRVWVIPTDEESIIAAQTCEVLALR